MKAMIMAAGRGVRMGALTKNIPKPLLKVRGKALIEHHVVALVKSGIHEIIINTSYLGEQIRAHLGNGKRYGADIRYTVESEPLEVGGGIVHALPHLGREPFIVVNADIFTDYPFHHLPRRIDKHVHLVLVDTPFYRNHGDFYFHNNMLTNHRSMQSLTYAGIGVYHPCFFYNEQPGYFPLGPMLRKAVDRHLATAEYYLGQWVDIGTPERLAAIA